MTFEKLLQTIERHEGDFRFLEWFTSKPKIFVKVRHDYERNKAKIYDYRVEVVEGVMNIEVVMRDEFEYRYPLKLVKIARNLYALDQMSALHEAFDLKLFESLLKKLSNALDSLTGDEKKVVKKLLKKTATHKGRPLKRIYI